MKVISDNANLLLVAPVGKLNIGGFSYYDSQSSIQYFSAPLKTLLAL